MENYFTLIIFSIPIIFIIVTASRIPNEKKKDTKLDNNITKSENKSVDLKIENTKKSEENIENKNINTVIIKDINMEFGSMVSFMVKWAIASIPAIIILSLIGSIIFGLILVPFTK